MSKIIVAPNDVLGKKAERFDFGNNRKSLSLLLKEMERALLSANDPKGVGLAAPQIGKSLSIFLAKPSEKSKILAFINPRIIDTAQASSQKPARLDARPAARSKNRVRKLEGCLSLPSIWGEVLRKPSISLSYQDESGHQKNKKFSGFMATIIQHEVDHLEGILFPRRVLEQKGRLYKSSKNEKGEDEFEELTI